jgi:flagellar basal body-associated protein FliL
LITDQSSGTLTSDKGREHLKSEIVAAIKSGTDVKVHEILFTDLAVQ